MPTMPNSDLPIDSHKYIEEVKMFSHFMRGKREHLIDTGLIPDDDLFDSIGDTSMEIKFTSTTGEPCFLRRLDRGRFEIELRHIQSERNKELLSEEGISLLKTQFGLEVHNLLVTIWGSDTNCGLPYTFDDETRRMVSAIDWELLNIIDESTITVDREAILREASSVSDESPLAG